MGEEQDSAIGQVRRLFERSEAAAASASEELVQRDSFGELLAKMTESSMALTKLGFDAMDLVVRNLRLAGRQDIARLARQLARTEDKLERVLQEVEQLREESARAQRVPRGETARGRGSANGSAPRRAPATRGARRDSAGASRNPGASRGAGASRSPRGKGSAPKP